MPKLRTERLLLKPLKAEDASQVQVLYPCWEIIRYMVSSVLWPYPDNGAENYINNVALFGVEKRAAWIQTTRLREALGALIGLICLYNAEGNNRRFRLAPKCQGWGFMREANNVATGYWLDMLNRTVLRVPKVSLDTCSIRISGGNGMRLIKTEKKEYISGLLDSELWEITYDEWNARRVG